VPSGTPGEGPISGHRSLCLGYNSEGFCTGVLSARVRLPCANVDAIVAEILSPHGLLMVASDGSGAGRNLARFSAGDTPNWKAMAHETRAQWTPGQPIPLRAGRGEAASLLARRPSALEQTLPTVHTGRAIG